MRFSMIASIVLCLLLTVTISTSQAVDIGVVGADPGPNATGEIPAWEGHKNMTCPSAYTPGDYFPNPFKDEKPLFRIDHTNVDEYKDRLSPGQIMRVKKHKKFYMNIYPTHRNEEYCPEYYAAVKKNKETCYVDDNGVLQGLNGAIAFPTPKNGLEAIWNIRRLYAGDDARSLYCTRIVSPNGRIKKRIMRAEVLNYGERRLKGEPFPNPDKVSQKILGTYTYPADAKGNALLTVAYLDDNRLDNMWLYLPTLRRVRRAPTMGNGGQMDGENTMDEMGLEFKGTVNHWNWKLIGKKEMYVSYNNYDLFLPDADDEEECYAMDINPERIRYELHRVWVVEGTLKEGLSHPYSRRVGHYDEDSWQPQMSDRYDKRGDLWRMYEQYPYADACVKMRMVPAWIYMNLESGRYEFNGGCLRELPRTTVYDTGLSEDYFTVQMLRKMGR